MKKVCVITGTRAEYGLLKPLLCNFQSDNDIILQLLVTGTHLSSEFGYTYKEILEDGFEISEQIEIVMSSDTEVGTSKAMGLGLISFSEAFHRLKPDLVIVLGDRYETLSASIAALNTHITIAHIHGGEITEGAIDDVYRHAITKMSYLHFTSTEEYRKRVIQLGENPDRVYNVGAIAADIIKHMEYLSKEEMEKVLGLDLSRKTALFTYHPETINQVDAERQVSNILRGLDELKDLQIVFTMANSDMYGRSINLLVEQYVKSNSSKSVLFHSLGQHRYLSCMKYCACVIGNSSSGIIEAPSLHVPTVNIGERQRGRIQAASVINCLTESNDVSAAIRKALSDEFQIKAKNAVNPYGNGDTAEKIYSLIKEHLATVTAKRKKFYDINF